MTDFNALIEADKGQPARTIRILDGNIFEDWLKDQPDSIRSIVTAYKFVANPESYLILPVLTANDKSEAEQGDFTVVAGVATKPALVDFAFGCAVERQAHAL